MKVKTIAVLSFGLLCGGSAHAQAHPQIRDGFTLSAGLGAGSGVVTCDNCGTDRERSVTGYVRLGGALHPNLILGAEINGWSKGADQGNNRLTATFTTVNAIAQWYPKTTGGFFVDGGLGVGSLKAEFVPTGGPALTDKNQRPWLAAGHRL